MKIAKKLILGCAFGLSFSAFASPSIFGPSNCNAELASYNTLHDVYIEAVTKYFINQTAANKASSDRAGQIANQAYQLYAQCEISIGGHIRIFLAR